MNNKKLQINQKTLTPEQRNQLESYEQTEKQLTLLGDIADMTQELINIMDSQTEEGGKISNGQGALLMDMRDSLNALKDKETPETPDFAQPVVNAVKALEQTLGLAIKSIELNPTFNSPEVNVSPPSVDLKGVETILKKEMPEAFAKAIKLIPPVEIPQTDNSDLLKAWEGISEQLVSIETATRMKPLPGSMTISNLSEVTEAITTQPTERYDYDDSTTIYTATAPVGTLDAGPGWTITKYDLTDTNDASGKIATDVSWDDRAIGSYS